jgi:hypothetical protein
MRRLRRRKKRRVGNLSRRSSKSEGGSALTIRDTPIFPAVIASEAKQSIYPLCCDMDCFATLAMTGRERCSPSLLPLWEKGRTPPHTRTSLCDPVCDCPTGKSLKTCPALAQKIFRFAFTPNQPYNISHPAPTRGAYRDRHGRWVRGAVAAAVPGAQEVFAG